MTETTDLTRRLFDHVTTIGTLDLRAEYYLEPRFGKLRVYFEASDLLNGTGSPDVQELIGSVYSRATYLGGRRFRLGVSTTF